MSSKTTSAIDDYSEIDLDDINVVLNSDGEYEIAIDEEFVDKIYHRFEFDDISYEKILDDDH
jgi:hypothetical protein